MMTIQPNFTAGNDLQAKNIEKNYCGRYFLNAVSSRVRFGQNVRRWRLLAELQSKELARTIGVKPSVVSAWENNRRGLPETPTLLKLAKALNCSIDNLLEGVDADYDRVLLQRMETGIPASLEQASQTDADSKSRHARPITEDRQQRQSGGGADPSVPQSNAEFLTRLADVCLLAAEATDRSNIQGVLDELAVAFDTAAAATPTERADRSENARQRVQQSRRRRERAS